MTLVARVGLIGVVVAVTGCPQGEMAPSGSGNSGTATDSDGTGSTGSGTAGLDDTTMPDPDGSGGGTMGNGPVVVECGELPASAVGAEYTHTPTVFGGDGDYAWAASGLPDGLEIDDGDGEITGQPTASGAFDIVVTVTDGMGDSSDVTCALTVNEGLGVEPPADPLAEEACVTGTGSLLDLIIEGTGDGSPIECSFDGGGGNGRLPDGITVDPETCQMQGTLRTDRFGVYAFIVRGEQNGVSVYAPYCVTQDDAANTYAVDVDHSGAVSVPDVPLVRFFDPAGSVDVGQTGDPVYTAIDASVCMGSNSCFFGFSFNINSSPFDSETFDITDDGLVTNMAGERIGLTHGLAVSAAAIDRSFQTRPWVQNVTMSYCLSTVGADCSTSPAVAENGGAQLEISIIMFPQAR